MLTRAYRRSLSCGRWIQSIPPHPISLTSILILTPNLCIGFPHGIINSGSPTKTLYACIVCSTCYMPCPSNPPWLDHSNDICRKVLVIKLLIMQFYPASYYALTRVRIFSSAPCPQPQSMFFPLTSETKFHTRGKIIVLYTYFNLYVFRQQARRQKVLNWMVASISRIQCVLNFLMNYWLIRIRNIITTYSTI
jgi:hypothetical protein